MRENILENPIKIPFRRKDKKLISISGINNPEDAARSEKPDSYKKLNNTKRVKELVKI